MERTLKTNRKLGYQGNIQKCSSYLEQSRVQCNCTSGRSLNLWIICQCIFQIWYISLHNSNFHSYQIYSTDCCRIVCVYSQNLSQ
jgi:hypothetical protein